MIDFVVRGEGEVTLDELVACLKHGDDTGLKAIAGVSYCAGGGIQHGPDRAPIIDLDHLPWPAIDALIDVDRYRPVDFGSIMTSRGCPFGCTFCGVSTVWGRGIRNRSPQGVVDEIELLKQQRGISYFSFRDATFTLNRQRVVDLCRLILDRNLGIRWECLTRIDLLDEDLLTLMMASDQTADMPKHPLSKLDPAEK